mmetsp:Transcript_31373/g.61973  ORF Transcript_31373/g.61973 Transcript_31373/m.61973 type:complete len:99 (-) Transcript_31373:1044-1340(-)
MIYFIAAGRLRRSAMSVRSLNFLPLIPTNPTFCQTNRTNSRSIDESIEGRNSIRHRRLNGRTPMSKLHRQVNHKETKERGGGGPAQERQTMLGLYLTA